MIGLALLLSRSTHVSQQLCVSLMAFSPWCTFRLHLDHFPIQTREAQKRQR